MKLKKLLTPTFEKNVGARDRVFRLLSGLALVGAGWYVALPLWASFLTVGLGVMWTATGVFSRCSVYYLFGYSTCPARKVSP